MGSHHKRIQRAQRKHRIGVSRRQFLFSGSMLGAVSASGLLTGCGSDASSPTNIPTTPSEAVPNASVPVQFVHGVASGDPLSDRVMLWTRVTPSQNVEPLRVLCKIYADEARQRLLRTEVINTNRARDYTVKLDATGLAADTVYYYQFECNGTQSRLGRTKTAPSNLRNLTFGLVSCSSYAHGFFNAYRLLAAKNPQQYPFDAIIHLGDYIYEYASDPTSGDDVYGTTRPYEPTGEIKTLSDYRTRHAYYKREQDLQNLHALFPFITTWDDHESADNSYTDGASNHQAKDGVWSQRKSWAQQAYDEWMPIRLPEAGNAAKIWRKLSYGGMADILMLDTRLWQRSEPASTPINPLTDQVNSPSRTLLGPEQKAWLKSNLSASKAQWKLIGNQVVFHQWNIAPGSVALGAVLPDALAPLKNLVTATALNGDSWDGYTAERSELIAHLRQNKINNTVFLTGDVHSSWIADITDDPNNPLVYNPLTGQGSVATEFVVTSVTSPGLPIPDEVVQAIRVTSPHIKHVNMSQRGYSVLKLSADKAVCEYWAVDTIDTRGGGETLATTATVTAGSNQVKV